MFFKSKQKIVFSNIFKQKRAFCHKRFPGESTFGMIKPDGIKHMPAIFDTLHQEGFYIRSLRMSKFTPTTAKAFYSDHVDREYFEDFRTYLLSGPIVAMRIGRLNAIKHWRKVMGPRTAANDVARSTETQEFIVPDEEANNIDPNEDYKVEDTIRGKYAASGRVNVVHGADSDHNSVKEIDFFFGTSTMMKRCEPSYPNTILMLKPEILLDGKLGVIIKSIHDSGCIINAMQIFDTKELEALSRKMGVEDAPKVLKRKVNRGNTLLMEVSNPNGYNQLLDEMLHIENFHATGYTHFDRGDEKLSEKIFI
jgi:nucleoside-diphosphate kinase